MTLLTLVIAFLIEQLRPLSVNNPAFKIVSALAQWLAEALNAGERVHGRIAWLLLVVPLVVLAYLIGLGLAQLHPLLAFGWNVLLLYFTLGFRQFSHYFTDIQLALNAGDLSEARTVLTRWAQESDRNFSAADLDASEIVRHTVRLALIASHRHVFGVLFWAAVLPGTYGALLYRLADYLNRRWNLPTADNQPESDFGAFARSAFTWLDWIPVRLTALGFAVVGNFEDAIYCWRTRAQHWPGNEPGILLASGEGALGVRLRPLTATIKENPIPDGTADQISEPETDWEPGVPQLSTLRTAVGLVWRSVILWLIVLVLVSAGSWIR
ncbi:MAG: CobD/CbiB family protein [Burkholderiaceae bacterium]|nr:MAG: CobD/CbiB family protein [Burkholderiaceae bacterium]